MSRAAAIERELVPLFALGAHWQAARTRGVDIWLFIPEPRRLPGLDGMVYRRESCELWAAYHPRLGKVHVDLSRSDATALVECTACFLG
jgi:hypothetical protein